MTKKKPYFPNNWKEYKEAPSEWFTDCSFKEFMKWRVHGWEILSSHICIIRAESRTGKVKEYSYRRTNAAEKRIDTLMNNPDVVEITIADEDQVQVIRRD